MTFESYITYEEYVELGGTVSEDAFPIFERKAQRQLDYITFNRIKYLTTVPDVVKEVLTEFINKMYAQNEASSGASSAASYSNGVETIQFEDNAERKFLADLSRLAIAWLPEFLTARSVSFDVEAYLQPEDNNP